MIGRRALLLLAAMAPVLALALAGQLGARSALAHPLGNFTVNRYSRIEVYSDAVRVHYVLDMAEIPTFQAKSSVDTDGDGTVSQAEAGAYAQRLAGEIVANTRLAINGESAALNVAASQVSFPEGQAGLQTTRLTALLAAPASATSGSSLEFSDDNYSDRLGWKEVIVRPAAGVVLSGDPPMQDVSSELTSYPADLTSSPLDVRSVSFGFDNTRGASAPADSGVQAAAVAKAPERSGAGFAGLVDTDNLTLSVILLALLAALGFGALHALEPGHGKTFVAAYFVGVRGTVRQALSLGGIIAVTHTAGVLLLGAVTLFGSHYIVPERLYPWLSLASALMILALGLRLIVFAGGWRRLHALLDRLPLPHLHHHHRHREHEAAGRAPTAAPPWRTLVALGLADGLMPSPSALVVLLAAVSLHREAFGMLLIVAFSLGLALVLTIVCLGLLFARRLIDAAGRYRAGGALAGIGARLSALPAAATLVPLGGAGVLLAVGALLTARALTNPALAIF